MKLKITEVYNKENGHLLGYAIYAKPFPFIPYWHEIKHPQGVYKTRDEAEHDIVWLLSIHGQIKQGRKYV